MKFIPIDENIPQDKEVVLFWPDNIRFNLRSNNQIAICTDAYLNHCAIKPTHYCELPEDPKE